MPEQQLPKLNPDGPRRKSPDALWVIVLAFALPTVIWTLYLLLTRRALVSSAALDWIALLIAVGAGLSCLRRSRVRMAKVVWVNALYAVCQAVWLFVCGLILVQLLTRA
ncbi:MAG: hypothetical protein H7144_10830 [Burkholderiales bacterium]|nr:hypothetical protein [Phycisphaerae bacterium]